MLPFSYMFLFPPESPKPLEIAKVIFEMPEETESIDRSENGFSGWFPRNLPWGTSVITRVFLK